MINKFTSPRRRDVAWKAQINHAYLPLKVSLAYLLGTYLLFLIGPFREQADNLPLLALFILSATAMFGIGYHLSIVQSRRYQSFGTDDRTVTPLIRTLILAGAIWFFVFSLSSLAEYGATSFADVLNAAMNPSASYFGKFDVYAEQQANGRTNLAIQVSVLTGALYATLIPLTVYFWRGLSFATRAFAVASALSYISYFVFIGTQKGVGDVLVMTVAAFAVSAVSLRKQSPPLQDKRGSRPAPKARAWIGLVSVVLGMGFVGYMANNQGDRLQGLSIEGQFVPDPFVTSIFGEKFSRGLVAASYYPTNGYIGLSKNLGVPFEWAGGLGGAPALASYKTQYVGGTDPMDQSYPARTEAETGWPAGLLWATIYPWLASDLTFPGAALFMSVAGWFVARMWVGAHVERDPLSLILFCQMAIFIAYVPANNQLMTSRYTAIGLFTLLGIYAARNVTSRIRSSFKANPARKHVQ
jgi:hypothetical protein